MKPLFIPLKRKYFEKFRDGTKSIEYRKYGPRWNEKTCTPGRSVTLSLGYGKQHRISGVITFFRKSTDTSKIKGWNDCYGPDTGPAACIAIDVKGV